MAFVIAIYKTILNPKLDTIALQNDMMKRKVKYYLVSL